MGAGKSKISLKPWGDLRDNEGVLFRLENSSGAYVELTNYGATLVSVVVPDRNGKLKNVILSYPSLRDYLSDKSYIGSTVGRFANRIGGAQFKLNNELFNLEKNDGDNTNHGGTSGFHARVFNYGIGSDKLIFTLFSNDGEGGYPGTLKLKVEYSWTEENELIIQYTASSDRDTVMNFTNHAYFNLSEHGDIFNHQLTIEADDILETTPTYIPTGKIISAGAKTFKGDKLSARVAQGDEAIIGLNTYYVLRNPESPKAACVLKDTDSGRVLEVFTTYPGVQLYTGDFLQLPHKPFEGLCLECQYYPDSPNHSHFPSTTVRAGDVYNEKIVYRFSVENNKA